MTFDKQQAWQKLSGRIDHKIRQRKRIRRGLTALAMIGVVGMTCWYSLYRDPVAAVKKQEFQLVTTDSAERKEIQLADGSRVLMNKSSVLEFPAVFSDSIRHIRMPAGEATFFIAKDAKRPMHVDLGDNSVVVLGTTFNINQYGDVLLLTLQEGAVSFNTPEQAYRLEPGQRLAYHHNDKQVKIQTVDAEQELAWRDNRWVFQQMPLSWVVERIARENNLKIVDRRKDKMDPEVTLIHEKKKDALDELLAMLALVSRVHITHLDETIILK